MTRYKLLCLATCFGLLASPAWAAGFDGSQPLICASIETFDCSPASECLKGTAESINAPQFIRLDFEKSMAFATRPDGEQRSSKIEMLTQSEGELILQGVQGTLGWSMAIAQEGGTMALTAAGKQVGFVVFGACIPL